MQLYTWLWVQHSAGELHSVHLTSKRLVQQHRFYRSQTLAARSVASAAHDCESCPSPTQREYVLDALRMKQPREIA